MYIKNTSSYLASQQVVVLVANLLDYEKNVFAEYYNQIFAECPPDVIKDLKLDVHIERQISNDVNYGLMVVDCYLTTRQAKGQPCTVEEILASPKCIQMYQEWKESEIARSNFMKPHNPQLKTKDSL